MKQNRANSKRSASADEPWPVRIQAILLAAVVTLIVVTPLIPSESAVTIGSHVIPVMGWMVLLVVWAMSALAGAHPRPLFGPTMIVLLLFLILHSASAWVMADSGHARLAINALWQWVSFGILFFLVRQVLRNDAASRAMVSSLIAVAFGLAALGFYQNAYSLPQLRAEFAQNPEATLQAWGINAPPDSPERRHFVDRLDSTEPIGTFALANSLAGVLAASLVLFAGSAGWLWFAQPAHWPRRICTLFVLVTIFGCLLMTKSRAALVAVSVGLAVSAVMLPAARRWMRWQWLVVLLIVLAGAVWAGTKFGGLDRQVLTEAPKSLQYRFQYWQASMRMIVQYPWTGCGPGNFKQYYTQYKLPAASETVSDPHNFLLEIGATAGLPALVAFVAIGLVGAFSVRRARIGTSIPVVAELARAPTGSTSHAQVQVTAATQKATAVEKNGAHPNAGALSDRTSIRAVYWGTVVGIALAFPIGWSANLFPDPALLWLSLPMVVLGLWTVHPWVQGGELHGWQLGAALGVLLVNLLAAGGISYPGVGQLVWLLPALLLNVLTVRRVTRLEETMPSRGRSIGLEGRSAGVVLGCGVLLAIACYFTMYRPVLDGQRHIASMSAARQWQEIDTECRAAADADPWWAEPWEHLGAAAFQRWRQSPSVRWSDAVQTYADEAVKRDRHSSRLRRRYGDWLYQISLLTGDTEMAAKAASLFRQATELYPNSNVLHAQLALALLATNELGLARMEAKESLRLDVLTPHEELKLSQQRLRKPPWWRPGNAISDDAEQLMLELRKFNDSEKLPFNSR